MNDVFSSTALATRQREVKDAAAHQVVRITENGCGAYIFASEEAYAAAIAREREDAAYNARLEYILQRGRQDFSAGNYISGIEALKSAIAEG